MSPLHCVLNWEVFCIDNGITLRFIYINSQLCPLSQNNRKSFYSEKNHFKWYSTRYRNESSYSGVARICCQEGQSWKLGHAWGTRVGLQGRVQQLLMTNSFVTRRNAVLIERAVSCWHLHQVISQTTQHLDSWPSDLLLSELKLKLLEVKGARVPVPHSCWRHCQVTVPPCNLVNPDSFD